MSAGFSVVPNWILDDETLSEHAVMIFVALQRHIDRSRNGHPPLAVLAKTARVSISTAKSAFIELRERGLVQGDLS